MLLNAQNTQSDIDLVIYDRKIFNEIRAITGRLIADNHLQDLSLSDWEASYHRRGCDISLEDYIWHEQRKLNKAIINGRKFDLGLVTDKSKQTISYKKRGHAKLTATVIDDEQSFDYPAVFKIDHPEIAEIVCYTATYVGQAFIGEIVEAEGLLEQTDVGPQRLLVGSSREAAGEFIKVVNCRVKPVQHLHGAGERSDLPDNKY
jgi:predicted nucleotidyltransferase